jgi:uncharacterized protein (DUF1330 family)
MRNGDADRAGNGNRQAATKDYGARECRVTGQRDLSMLLPRYHEAGAGRCAAACPNAALNGVAVAAGLALDLLPGGSRRNRWWRPCRRVPLVLRTVNQEVVMKQYIGLGLAMLTGTVIGAAAVSGLHAQAKPPVYLVSEIDVTNPEAYGAEFAPKAQATVKAAGARFIAIGGTAGVGSKPITSMGGTPPKRVTIQVWDSLDALNAWYNSADYQAALRIGEKYATFRRYAVEGQ